MRLALIHALRFLLPDYFQRIINVIGACMRVRVSSLGFAVLVAGLHAIKMELADIRVGTFLDLCVMIGRASVTSVVILLPSICSNCCLSEIGPNVRLRAWAQ